MPCLEHFLFPLNPLDNNSTQQIFTISVNTYTVNALGETQRYLHGQDTELRGKFNHGESVKIPPCLTRYPPILGFLMCLESQALSLKSWAGTQRDLWMVVHQCNVILTSIFKNSPRTDLHKLPSHPIWPGYTVSRTFQMWCS